MYLFIYFAAMLSWCCEL